ncbi:AAA family ATPase [Actinokineospora pegani]|uniref:AAA family ATPase n=1 Tax=Actinokineospora pegani TaxID=2654637 RepID=UPI0012EA63AC|nr:AAA family ATPase [Actinokineospora pegani]
MRARPGGFLRQVRLDAHDTPGGYPFTLPVVRWLAAAGGLDLDPAVTFLVGDNGSGKSTLVEAIAVAAGFNPEGGSQSFRFATRASESSLGDHVVLRWGVRKPRTGFFLRAESFYNVATEIERLHREGGGLLSSYGGVSPHERSHGESFLDVVAHRFGPDGLYVLDEPEAALSVRGCLALVSRVVELAGRGCQFLIATHSPVLLAVPGALILQIDGAGEVEPVAYDEAADLVRSAVPRDAERSYRWCWLLVARGGARGAGGPAGRARAGPDLRSGAGPVGHRRRGVLPLAGPGRAAAPPARGGGGGQPAGAGGPRPGGAVGHRRSCRVCAAHPRGGRGRHHAVARRGDPRREVPGAAGTGEDAGRTRRRPPR